MLELVNTSLPNGLIPGTHGFATVAMTKGLPDALRRRLEALCAYTHKTSAHDASYLAQNPVNWLHAVLPQGEHVVGRVAASDFDYTGRTNRLARLLIFPGREMPAVGGVAILQAESARLSAPWSGEPRHLPTDKEAAARLAALHPPAFSSPENWTNLFGPDGAQLAQRFAWQLEKSLKGGGKPIYFKTSAAFDQNGTKLLGLFADIIDLLPAELRSSVTFSTYPDALPAGTNCLLRGAFDGDRNFAIASSTQPWVDCEHAKVVHPEMLPSEAEPKPAAAVSGKGGVPAALDAAAPQSLDSPHAAPKRKQHPSGTPQRSHGAGSPYLLPPRSDDKKSGINVPACVVTILVLVATGIFVVWQVGEKKKKEAKALAEVDVPQQNESPDQVIDEYKIRIRELVRKLKEMKDNISKAETLDSLDSLNAEVSNWKKNQESEAREHATRQAVRDDELQEAKKEFDDIVAEVEKAIKERRDKLDRERRAAEANARANKEQAEAEAAPKAMVTEAIDKVPAEPADTRPEFFAAKVWKPYATENDVKQFILDASASGPVEAFYYSLTDGGKLHHEKVSANQLPMGIRLSPTIVTMSNRSTCLFIVFFSRDKEEALWFWNCSATGERASKWFTVETNGSGSPDRVNLKELAFGPDPEIYGLYEKQYGKPTYSVKCSPDSNESKLQREVRVQTDFLSVEDFKPLPGNQNEIETKLSEAQREFAEWSADAQRALSEIKKMVDDISNAIDDLKTKITEISENKAKKKDPKELEQKRNSQAEDIVEKWKRLNQTLTETKAGDRFPGKGVTIKQPPNVKDLKQAAKAEVIDQKLEGHLDVLQKIQDLKVEDRKDYQTRKKNISDLKKRLMSIGGGSNWREDAQKAKYWISAVSSTEPKGKSR